MRMKLRQRLRHGPLVLHPRGGQFGHPFAVFGGFRLVPAGEGLFSLATERVDDSLRTIRDTGGEARPYPGGPRRCGNRPGQIKRIGPGEALHDKVTGEGMPRIGAGDGGVGVKLGKRVAAVDPGSKRLPLRPVHGEEAGQGLRRGHVDGQEIGYGVFPCLRF